MLACAAVVPVRAARSAGVIVEQISKQSEAARAELQAGDVILHWSRGDAAGEICSPFDLVQVEIEQAPRGNVLLTGKRGTEERTWTLGWKQWGVQSRPEFQSDILTSYLKSQELASAGKLKDADILWREIAAKSEAAISSWLLLHGAEQFAAARQWDNADKAFNDAIKAASGLAPEITARIFRSWGDSFRQRSDYEGARVRYQSSVEQIEKGGAKTLTLALCLNNLGAVNWQIGDLAKAQEIFTRSLEIRQHFAPGTPLVAITLNNLGTVAWQLGDLDLAEKYHRQALSIREALEPDSEDVAVSLNNLGTVSWRRGDLAKAAEYYRGAYIIHQRLAPESIFAAGVLSNLGIIAFEQGDLVAAEGYDRQALAIRQKLAPDSIDVTISLANLGLLFLERGNLSQAEEYLHQSLVILEKVAPDTVEAATALTDLGALSKEKGDLIKAEQYLQRALAIEEKQAPEMDLTAETLFDLGDVRIGQGNYDDAEKLYRKALIIVEKAAPGNLNHVEILAALADVARHKHDVDSAGKYYTAALDALENQVVRVGGSEEIRSHFRARHGHNYYKDYISFLLQQQHPEEAFHVLERERARTLLEMLSAGHVDVRHGIEEELLLQEQSLQTKLSSAEDKRLRLLSDDHTDQDIAASDQEIAGLLAQYKELEDHIRARSPVYAALKQPRSLTVNEVQHELLDGETVLLEYSLHDDRSFLFAVTSQGINVHELPKRADIEIEARKMHALLSRPAGSDVRHEKEVCREQRLLSRMLLDPAAPQISGKRLLIVSDGALQYIPFAALSEPGQNCAPLIVGHEVLNLPSASVLAVLRQQEVGKKVPVKQVAILADPVFGPQDERIGANDKKADRQMHPGNPTEANYFSDGRLTRSLDDVGLSRSAKGSLPRLLFTRREAHQILSLTPAGQGTEILDFDASRATAMSNELAQYRIVHFATHGIMNSEHPELSGLVFSLVDRDGQPQNGFLDLADIFNLNLPADLVVLSACETALGEEIQGEGMLGLTRGFMYAGASRVLASIWNADDVATAELMTRFYKGVEQGGLRPALALRNAQIQMWKQRRWSDPYYWASFELQGEWK